jgi:adenylylsulfate kinase-like enzyme
MIKISKSKVIWITGLSGSGKTTIGREVYSKLTDIYPNTVLLDGDSFREVIGNDLGYSPKDRLENAKRLSRMCVFLVSQNINVVCCTVSLYKEIHIFNRKEIMNYIEVFIDCEINELIKRDQKNLYSRAINGELDNVVGVNLPFDPPGLCELVIDNNEKVNVDEKAQHILDLVFSK